MQEDTDVSCKIRGGSIQCNMAPQCWGFLVVVLVLLFCTTEEDHTNGNIIAARVEVSVVLIYFEQKFNINAHS